MEGGEMNNPAATTASSARLAEFDSGARTLGASSHVQNDYKPSSFLPCLVEWTYRSGHRRFSVSPQAIPELFLAQDQVAGYLLKVIVEP